MTHPRPETSGAPLSRHAWRPLDLLFLALGLALLAYLLYTVGWTTLREHIYRLRWTYLILLALYGGVHLIRAISWRLCLGADSHKLPFWSALKLWLAGEAVAYFSFGWSGEAFRAAAARHAVPVERCLSSLVVSKILYIYASLLVMTLSLILCLFLLPLHGTLLVVMAAGAVLSLSASTLPFVASGTVTRLVSALGNRLGRRHASRWFDPVERFLRAVERDLAATSAQNPATFFRLVGLNFLASLAGVLEVYLILRALGAPLSLPAAMVVEGLSKILGLFAFLVPGNVGVREGGTALILGLFGLSVAPAVTLSLIRRARAFGWALIGSVILFEQGFNLLTRRAWQTRSGAEERVREDLPLV